MVSARTIGAHVVGQREPGRWRAGATTTATVLVELAFVGALVGAYALLVPHSLASVGPALDHARFLTGAEARLGIDVEAALGRAPAAYPALGLLAGLYYAQSVTVVPAIVATLLGTRGREQYARVRDAAVATTLLGFAVFWVWPVAPPCLLVSPLACGPVPPDPVAAVPSLHVAWAALCAAGLGRLGTVRARRLGVAHVALTVLVVLATGHHFVLDVLAGLLAAGLGWALTARRRPAPAGGSSAGTRSGRRSLPRRDTARRGSRATPVPPPRSPP